MSTRGALAKLARRAAQGRQTLPKRGGGGGPVPIEAPPSRPLAEQDELIWRDGSARPEPALDQFTLVSKYEALGTLVAGGLGFFATIGLITKFVSDDRPVVFKPRTVAVPPEVSQTFA